MDYTKLGLYQKRIVIYVNRIIIEFTVLNCTVSSNTYLRTNLGFSMVFGVAEIIKCQQFCNFKPCQSKNQTKRVYPMP